MFPATPKIIGRNSINATISVNVLSKTVKIAATIKFKTTDTQSQGKRWKAFFLGESETS